MISYLLVSLIILAASPAAAANADLFAKFQARSCTNCHDFFVQSRNGLAFNSHKGRSVEMCTVCHQKSVTGFEHPEEWFAQPDLYTSGMTAKETCESTKKAIHASFKSSILLRKQIEKHLFEDPRVLWGIE